MMPVTDSDFTQVGKRSKERPHDRAGAGITHRGIGLNSDGTAREGVVAAAGMLHKGPINLISEPGCPAGVRHENRAVFN
jgi:hypothetical protein